MGLTEEQKAETLENLYHAVIESSEFNTLRDNRCAFGKIGKEVVKNVARLSR